MSQKPHLFCALLFLLLTINAAASAQQLGPGSNLPGATNLDGAGARLNIAQQGFVNLGPGTYDVLSFEYSAAATAGNVQPFLATPTANPNQYTVLWVGPTTPAPGAAGIETELYALATQQFELTAAGDVYAGFNSSQNIVFFANSGTTDHNGAANFGIIPGSIIGPFSNNDLNRSYAFEINIAEAQAIPEPASIALWGLIGLGVVGFGSLRLRRK